MHPTLEVLHLAKRYRENVGNVIDTLYEIFSEINNKFNNEGAKKLLNDIFNNIKKETADTSRFTSIECESFSEFSGKLNFSELLKESIIDQKILEKADFLAFKIVDFSFVFGNEKSNPKDKKLFSEWFFRSSQLLYKQKGQLWLLNFINNLFEQEVYKHNDIAIIKNIIRKNFDLDFCPYPLDLKDEILEREILSIKKNSNTKTEYNFYTELVKPEHRKMGFELEHQIASVEADRLDKKPNGEDEMLAIAHKIYKTSGLELIEPVLMSRFKEGLATPEQVMEYGSLTRDASNNRYPGYISCEYSSPAKPIEALSLTIRQLCELLGRQNKGLVREDCGTHIHVSIEDLKENPSDSDEIKKQKLNSLKAIFINFILMKDVFESVLPEYRRGDNSMYSGQAHETFVGGDRDFMIGLIKSCHSYDKLKSVLMVGGKYLSLAPFTNTVEFRSFPATTNAEVLCTWAKLLNEFVDQSIRGIPAEKCVNNETLKKLLQLTNRATIVYGMSPNDTQNICFKCNTIKFEEFTNILPPLVRFDASNNQLKINIKPLSSLAIQIKTAEYIQKVNRCLISIGYLSKIPGLDESSVAMSIKRRPGEYLKQEPIKLLHNINNTTEQETRQQLKEENSKTVRVSIL